ncbi:Na+/H+ antiporter NhaC [Psychromonas ossibalaenae]|uniref:Na+/H+ antiporter NhaC n=1 Tax=Psychromonas ossibalaenae TaxID=444922 RepID=UPI00037318B8|nr:Na+/H+ antiporter NhaC [Psychromonas ossibalaenae]
MDSSTIKPPGFIHALITFLTICTIIGIGLFFYALSLHSLLLLCLLTTSGSAWYLYRTDFNPIIKAMNSGIERALTSIYIFLMIGVLIAAFIQSGTVATLIYYGLTFISPTVFLPAGLILCSLMSLATGTSWGTVGTAGVVLIAVGTAMGIPAPVVAGMIIAGATFGDKMSPVSDTTNLAAMAAGTELTRHIKSMHRTTGPAYLITLLVFAVIGIQYAENTVPADDINILLNGLKQAYQVHIINLLPLVTMLALIYLKVSALPAMSAAAVAAVMLAVTIQDAQLTQVLNALFSGGNADTGIAALDNLLTRGGISAMMWTLSLALLALALGGILDKFGFLQVLIYNLLRSVKRQASLITMTITTCFVSNMTLGEAYMSIILNGQLYGETYDNRQIDRSVLSRSLEEGATLTTALIPWTTGGAFFAATLGVNVIDYAPWAILNWLNPLIAICFAYSGISLVKNKAGETQKQA